MMETENSNEFPGFRQVYSRDFFIYPTVLEEYWHTLSGSEQKVLDFILRQTIGYQKVCDYIALSQFTDGVQGRTSNFGTGLSQSQVRRCLVSLEEKGFIEVNSSRGRISQICLALEESDPRYEQPDEDEVVIDIFDKTLLSNN